VEASWIVSKITRKMNVLSKKCYFLMIFENIVSLNHEITRDAVMKKAPPHRLPRFEMHRLPRLMNWLIFNVKQCPFRPTTRTFYLCLQRHNSLAAIARELFKSSTDAASLLFSIKELFWFGLGVLLGGARKMGSFWMFDQLWLALDANPMSQHLAQNSCGN